MLEQNTSVGGFVFSGGALCLDFANTLDERLSQEPLEALNTYMDLIRWSQEVHMLKQEEAAQLLALARSNPQAAENWLAVSKQTRELIYRIFCALANSRQPVVEDMQLFNRILASTMSHTRLIAEEAGFAWSWGSEPVSLEWPLWPIVHSAAHLLTSPDLAWLRICASESCDWLFLDTSKNHSRRWCDMKSCGNRAKARRHHLRTKSAFPEK